MELICKTTATFRGTLLWLGGSARTGSSTGLTQA